MATEWKTAEKGIRYREHPTRKNGIRPDRYYTLRFYSNRKRIEEALGWATDGWTLERARTQLVRLREAHRLGTGAQTLQEGRAIAQRLREEQKKEEERQQAASVTLLDFWEQTYLPAQLDKKTHSLKTEVGLFRLWLQPVLGSVPLVSITAVMLEEVKRALLEAGRSARTIQYVLAVFSQAWNCAQSRGLVDGVSPCRKVKVPRVDNRRMRFLSPKEAKNLLKTLKKHSVDTHDAALLSLFCGLRFGEIHSLVWADIDFANEVIAIRDPKNRQNRFAHMTPEILTMLQARQTDSQKQDHVFPSVNDSERKFISKSFAKTVKEIGLNQDIQDARQKVVFHTLRHTFASWLVQNGTPIYTVAALMGHTTQAMTQRYAHLAPDNTRRAALGLSGILDSAK